jgi:hypothetical protein
MAQAKPSHVRICDARLPPGGGGRLGLVALPVKALKAGQEPTGWTRSTATESVLLRPRRVPGRFVGSTAATAGLEGVASAEQVRAMFQGLDPVTGEVRCAPLWRADLRSKLAAGPLLEALKAEATERGLADLEALAGRRRSG